MELGHFEEVHLVLFYLAVNKLTKGKTQSIFVNSWTFWVHKIYIKHDGII